MSILLIEDRKQGFFSCFNLILCGITKLINANKQDFYVKWNNPLYQADNNNLFDKYFWSQDCNNLIFKEIYSAFNLQYDNDINKKIGKISIKNLDLLKTLVKKNYFNNPIVKKCSETSFKSLNCLGVHVRKTDHSYHGLLLENDLYFKKIDENLDYYGNIFLASDDKEVVLKFKNRYGNLLNINENIIRVTGNVGIHNHNFKDKEKLVLDVITDAFSLSFCDKILITQSNISNYIKVINPDIKYEYIDKDINYTM